DDDACRKGVGVPAGLHRWAGRRPLPAFTREREPERSGGRAAALLRGYHARREISLPDACDEAAGFRRLGGGGNRALLYWNSHRNYRKKKPRGEVGALSHNRFKHTKTPKRAALPPPPRAR